MIVGVTGCFVSGKDTVAEYLADRYGFAHRSLSDVIRERLRVEGREITIPALTVKGNELRRLHGPGALANMALEAMDLSENHVVTSIRHPAEVEALERAGKFVLVFVDAPIEVRYKRSVARGRKGDCQSFEDFKAAEEAQLTSEDSNAQRLDVCRKMAHVVINNDSTLEALYEAVDGVMEQYLPICREME